MTLRLALARLLALLMPQAYQPTRGEIVLTNAVGTTLVLPREAFAVTNHAAGGRVFLADALGRREVRPGESLRVEVTA